MIDDGISKIRYEPIKAQHIVAIPEPKTSLFGIVPAFLCCHNPARVFPIFPSLNVAHAICGGIPRRVMSPIAIDHIPPRVKLPKYAATPPIIKRIKSLSSSDILIQS